MFLLKSFDQSGLPWVANWRICSPVGGQDRASIILIFQSRGLIRRVFVADDLAVRSSVTTESECSLRCFCCGKGIKRAPLTVPLWFLVPHLRKERRMMRTHTLWQRYFADRKSV